MKVVRNILEYKGLLVDVRVIVVMFDGGWFVKKEERLGVRSGSLEREE